MYSYLLINFFTILFPVILSFDKRVQFFRSWKYVLPALAISGVVFLIWDHLFTVLHVWSFNPDYITGIMIWELPLEEVLFFVTVPFACIFIYECLNYYIRRDLLAEVARLISIILIITCVAFLSTFYDRVYSLITFGLLLLILLYAEFIARKPLGRFYLAFIVSLLPFYIVNGILTSVPIVMYNDAENMGFRIFTIPFEDHFYSMAMLLLNILLFDHFKRKSTLAA